MSNLTQCMTITNHNFQPEVLKAKGLVLVDCWANWCGSLRVNPIEELAIEFAKKIKVGRLNVAVSEQIALRYNIRAVPTLLFFNEGQVIDRLIGGTTRQDLAHRINALITISQLSRR